MRACIGRRWRRAAPGRPVRGRCPGGVIGRAVRSASFEKAAQRSYPLPRTTRPRSPRGDRPSPQVQRPCAVELGRCRGGPMVGRWRRHRTERRESDVRQSRHVLRRRRGAGSALNGARRARADGGLLERLLLRGSRRRKGLSMTLWETEAALQASAERARRCEAKPVQALKGATTDSVTHYEVALTAQGADQRPRRPKISHRPRRRAGCGRPSVPRLAGGAHDRVVVRRLDGVASREYPRVQSRRRDSHGFLAWRSRPCRGGDDRSRRPPRCGGSGCAGRSLPRYRIRSG